MWYVIVIIIFVASFLISCREKVKINSKLSSMNIKIYPRENTVENAYFTKKDIEEKLVKISKTPIPDRLSMGAMCYDMAGPPDTASYICPTCGEKTLYKLQNDWNNRDVLEYLGWKTSTIRRELKRVDGINLIIDESRFCKKCSPKIETPKLGLIINMANSDDTLKVWGIDYLDVRLIAEFLKGELKHKGAQDNETPMAFHLEKLQKFFGTNLVLPKIEKSKSNIVFSPENFVKSPGKFLYLDEMDDAEAENKSK